MTNRFLTWLVAGIILCAGLMVVSTSFALYAIRWHDARLQNLTSRVYLGALAALVLGLAVLLVVR